MNRKRQKKIALSKVFNGGFKRQDFVEFIYGKVLYKVSHVDVDSLNLRSVIGHRYITLWKKDWGRIFKIESKEAIRKICLYNPRELRVVELEELKEFFRENLKS